MRRRSRTCSGQTRTLDIDDQRLDRMASVGYGVDEVDAVERVESADGALPTQVIWVASKAASELTLTLIW